MLYWYRLHFIGQENPDPLREQPFLRPVTLRETVKIDEGVFMVRGITHGVLHSILFLAPVE